ncbi:MAG: hypothetical protein JWM27_3884 [Gemmatimonadetes bacterium]|nr:hypothetical protein [Gemmatimonadota bacterium]
MTRLPFARLAPLALVLLAACAPPRPSEQDYLSVIPSVYRLAVADGQQHSMGEKADGPLLADVKSFAVNGRLVTLHPVDTAVVRRALGGPPFEVATPEQALLCDRSSMGSGCWVRQYGIFVHLKLMQAISTDRMQAHISITTTDRRTYPTSQCERIWKQDFTRGSTGWTETGRSLVKDCE